MPRQNTEDTEAPLRRIAANGNKLPTQLPDGIIVTDVCDKKWRIGKPIGLGGFGEIYLASDKIGSTVGADAEYVAKVEAHTSGPLFVEMNFYLRAARRDMVDEWVARQDLKCLGMPFYLGSGSFWHKEEKFRFLIIPRYGHDLEKTFQERGRRFHLKTVLSVGLQVLDALEYIHAQGYVHADIKGSNLLVGLAHGELDRIFLVDFGLATRFRIEGVHKEFNPDLRKAHDGTLEFTSRDAHQGAHSRRGDLEVLGYNLLQWLCSRLPWEVEEDAAPPDPDYVHAQKEGFMKDPAVLMRACFPDSHPPIVLEKYLKYVASLGFETRPDYELCRKLFRHGLREAGFKDDGRLQLDTEPTASAVKSRKRTGRKRASDEPENIAELKPRKVVRVSPAQPCRPKNCNTRATRSSPTTPMLRSHEHFDWERVLSSNPEKKFYKQRGSEHGARKSESRTCPVHHTSNPTTRNSKSLPEIRKQRGLNNPTPAMLQVMEARKHQKSRPNSGQTTPNKRGRSESISLPAWEIPTPAMEEVMQQRQRRPSSSRCSPEPPRRRGRGRKALSRQNSATQQRLTRAKAVLQAAIARPQSKPARPETLPLRSRLRPSESEEHLLPNQSSLPSVVTERPSRARPEIFASPEVEIGSENAEMLGKKRAGLRSRSSRSVSPAKHCLAPLCQESQVQEPKAGRRARRQTNEETPLRDKEPPLRNDMQYRLKVLMSIDECSSYAASTASQSSGSLYEPSESEDARSVESLKVRLCRGAGRTPKWRVERARRVLQMPFGVQRRVTRNCGKL